MFEYFDCGFGDGGENEQQDHGCPEKGHLTNPAYLSSCPFIIRSTVIFPGTTSTSVL
jgi:hypothetical protein